MKKILDKDLIDPETQIEPSEEFSAIIDNPKEKEASSLIAKVSVLDQDQSFFKKSFEDFPEFVKGKINLRLDYSAEYDYKYYLTQADPHYKLEIDFPKAALYQQSYVMSINITLLPGAQTKDCNIAVEDKLNNWLCFGKTRYYVALDTEKSVQIQFNVIPISVGEIPLPKVSVYQKKVEKKKEKVGKKPMLMINLHEVDTGNEVSALSEEKLEIRFTNSQMIQVFNNSTVNSEGFSLI